MASTVSLKELSQLPPTKPSQWIVEGLFRAGKKRPSLIIGYPHSGKSTIARQLAIAVAQGKSFLGRATIKSKVLCWLAEDSEQDVRDDFLKAGGNPDDEIHFLLPQAGAQNFKQLEEALNEHPDTGLVIIETFADFMSTELDDVKDNDSIKEVLIKFTNLIVAPNPHCCFMLLHHANKSDTGSSSAMLSIKKILGGTYLAAGTDTKLFLQQVSDADPRRIVQVGVRKGRPLEPTFLEFDPETLTATLGPTVIEQKIAKKQESKQQRDVEIDCKIMEAVAADPGRPKWDYKILGVSTKAFSEHVEFLIEARQLVAKPGGGDKGNAKLLYPAAYKFENTEVNNDSGN